jgi:hypothetical protein
MDVWLASDDFVLLTDCNLLNLTADMTTYSDINHNKQDKSLEGGGKMPNSTYHIGPFHACSTRPRDPFSMAEHCEF